jgi:antitoxin component YwqK of YwqJK toxin-antitoxin module
MGESNAPEPHIEHYGTGTVKLRGFQLDGEMHGAWTFFRTDGSMMRSGSFDRGRQVGPWRTFDRAGRMVKETDFGAGAQDGRLGT